jgi:hypothetical protein
MNKDGVITALYPASGGDMYYKETNILLDGGFGTDLRYKGFQMNLFFTIRQNPFVISSVYNGVPGEYGNQSTDVLNRWQKPGDAAKFARFTTQPQASYGNFSSSDGGYSNGSYIRLRNLSISYDMPAKWINMVKLQSFKIYFRGENLFVLTKYDGVDPDVPTLGVLPPAKLFTGGIQVSF